MTEGGSKKNIRTLAGASFLNDMGSDIIYPVWPLFVSALSGGNMAVLGLLDGLGDAIVSISQAASGYISDRVRKRKIFIWLGYTFGAMSRIGYAVSVVWPVLLPFRVLDRSGKIRSAPRDAIVADESTGENRGRNFGLLRAMDNLGAVVGILTCAALIHFIKIRLIFALAALPSFAAAFLVYRNIKEKRPSDKTAFKGISLKNLDVNLKVLLVSCALFSLGAFSYSFLLMLVITGGVKIGFVPVFYLIFTAVASVMSFPFGRLADKIGRKNVLALSYLLWAGTCVTAVFTRGYFFYIVFFVLYGTHKAALDPALKPLICELAPAAYRASVLGGFQLVIGLSAFPASLAAGTLWEAAGINAPFYVAVGLAASACLVLLFVREKKNLTLRGPTGLNIVKRPQDTGTFSNTKSVLPGSLTAT